MAVHISFLPPAYVGSVDNLALGSARSYETITAGGAASSAAEEGEFAYVVSGESAIVTIAKGTTPDPDAATATDASSAAIPLLGSSWVVLEMKAGEKIAAQALA